VAEHGERIEGVEWRLIAHDDGRGELLSVEPGVQASARFEDGRISGSSGCNRYAAGYRLGAGRLEIELAAGTMMACPDEVMAVESAFLAALARIAAASVTAGVLDLRDASDRTLLRFEASRITLTGTTWLATGINNGRGGIETLIAGSIVDAVFGEDGSVIGLAGCNRYRGSWSAVGPSIEVGPLASTRMACAEPEGVMAQEAAFLAAMGRASRYRIDLERLELRDAEGALQVAFETAGEG